MKRKEQFLGGLHCSQVLESLSDYLDDQCETELKKSIQSHLELCDLCESFGNGFSTMLARFKEHSSEAPEPGQKILDELNQLIVSKTAS